MELNSKIYVAGHTGMVGSAIIRGLRKRGYTNFICRTHSELDLTRQRDVELFFAKEKPEYVFLIAAKVGGIGDMIKSSADFMTINLQIQCNIIHASFINNVKKLIFASSAVVYPRDSEQPIAETALLEKPLELSSESYALAKIAGIKQCEYYNKQYGTNYISVVPANIYGPNGIFDAKRAHVIPAMMRRFHSAKVNGLDKVTIWGSGNARRELIYCDDVADGCFFLMENAADSNLYNLGCNNDQSMLTIAKTVKAVIGFEGEILTDSTKPEGAPKRLLDSSRINALGWKPSVSFENGLNLTYQWFLENVEDKDEIFL